MLKKAYGLCDAPKEWFDEVSRRMTESGWVAMKLEPCVWTLYDKGQLVAIAFVHVDDFVLGIKEDNDKAKQKHEELRNRWQWGSWETGCFRQTGVDVVQLADHSISLSFAAAAAKVEMIDGVERTNGTSRRCPAGIRYHGMPGSHWRPAVPGLTGAEPHRG